MRSMNRFRGKTAIVTGSGRGIGEATAEAFAREGANVVIAEMDAESGKAVAARLSAASEGRILFLQTDLMQPVQVHSMVDQTIKSFGHIDILVNNAGGGPKPFEGIKMALDDWRFVVELNLTSVWVAMVSVLDHMIANGGGAIVNVASLGAYRHSDFTNAAYVSAKAGMVRLTEEAAAFYARNKVRVNAIAPGFTLTPVVRTLLSAEQQLTMADTIGGLPKLADPADQANAILYLASDEASHITGQVIRVDGGQYVR